LKKPNNKTAKKQYFKELAKSLQFGPETNRTMLANNDLETFAKILQFADISKELDLKVLILLLQTLRASICTTKAEDRVETFFNFAHHNIPAILFQILIDLIEKILVDYNKIQSFLLDKILRFFNIFLCLKRVEKLLRNTEGFETISQQDFWEPIYFSAKLEGDVKMHALWFSLRISRQKSLTQKFVEKYLVLAREHISAVKRECALDSDPISAQNTELACRGMLQSISHIILESEQGDFFKKFLPGLQEKSHLISTISDNLSHCIFGKKFRALVKCANCKVLEKSEKEFQKCSRCRFVFYCSKACQRKDWQNHKEICKQIRKKN